jgi:hypothetical protein
MNRLDSNYSLVKGLQPFGCKRKLRIRYDLRLQVNRPGTPVRRYGPISEILDLSYLGGKYDPPPNLWALIGGARLIPPNHT